jgi:peroxiredoxin
MKFIIAVMLVASIVGYAGELTSLKIGDKAPEFKLKNYDGKEYELAKVTKENKYTVVMFISTECPVSNGYNERMVKLYDSYNAGCRHSRPQCERRRM